PFEPSDTEGKPAWIPPCGKPYRIRHPANNYNLTDGPDPSTRSRNTLGGMIGNNSCGTHSIMSEFCGPGPLAVDQVLELDVLTYRGERFTIGAMTETQLQDAIDQGGEKGRIL